MYCPQSITPARLSSTTDSGTASGLVDVLCDLFDAVGDEDLPRSLRLAHVHLRRHVSGLDRPARCDDELIEGLADIASEARRLPTGNEVGHFNYDLLDQTPTNINSSPDDFGLVRGLA